MIGYNTIDELYYGNIRPLERGIRENSDLAIATQMRTRHDEWLRDNLTGDAKEHLEKWIMADDEVNDIMNRECFRVGFQIALRLMMDAASSESENLVDLK